MRPAPLFSLLASLCLLPAALIPGCASVRGMEVINKTGQPLSVEYLDVGTDGATKVYSTGMLSADGVFANKVDQAELGVGKRVRFSLPEGSLDQGQAVTLFLTGEGRSRTYDLKLVNGRLVASEYKKGRN